MFADYYYFYQATKLKLIRIEANKATIITISCNIFASLCLGKDSLVGKLVKL